MGFVVDTVDFGTGEEILMNPVGCLVAVLVVVVLTMLFCYVVEVETSFKGIRVGGLLFDFALISVVVLMFSLSYSGRTAKDGSQIVCDTGSRTCTNTAEVYKATGIPVHVDTPGMWSDRPVLSMEWLDGDGRARQGGTLVYQGPHTIYLYDNHGRHLDRQDRKTMDRMIADSKEGVVIRKEMGNNADPAFFMDRGRFVSHDSIDTDESPAPKATLEAITVRDKQNLRHAWAMEFSGHMYLVPRK